MVDFSRLKRSELTAMAQAGRDIAEWQRLLAKTGDTIIGQVAGAGDVAMVDWAHYPPDDVYDPATQLQYFYHRHAPGRDPGAAAEHGHFHTFMRPRGMPPGTRPLVMPELAIADAPAQPSDPILPPVRQPNQGQDNDRFSHLVAIALDRTGAPVRLFTNNRWVTGETWYAAEDVIRMIDRLAAEPARPGWPLNRWLSALFQVYRGEIAALLKARDEAVMSWRWRHRGKIHVFEDRRLETTSSLRIDLAERLASVARALDPVA